MPERKDFLIIELAFFDCKKLYALMTLCNRPHIDVWSRIILLWRKAFSSFQDGDVSSLFLNPNLASQVLELSPDESTKFLENCIVCGKSFGKNGFIDRKRGSYFLHDWTKQGSGRLFVNRDNTRNRVEKHRKASPLRNANVTVTSALGNALDKSREEEKRIEENSTQTATAITDQPQIGFETKPAREQIPYSQIKELWNTMAGNCGLPTINEIKDRRAIVVRNLWKAHHDIEWFKALFARVAASDYLRSGAFSCGFDWCIKPANITKILEGNYIDRAKTETGAPDLAERIWSHRSKLTLAAYSGTQTEQREKRRAWLEAEYKEMAQTVIGVLPTFGECQKMNDENVDRRNAIAIKMLRTALNGKGE